VELPVGSYTRSELQDLEFAMDEVLGRFELYRYQDAKGYWLEFKRVVAFHMDIEEGEYVRHEWEEADEIYQANVRYQMDDDWFRIEVYSRYQEGEEDQTVIGFVLEMDEVDGVVHASTLSHSAVATIMETGERRIHSKVTEDGRLVYLEERLDGPMTTTLYSYDTRENFYYEQTHVPGNNDHFRVYDPEEEVLIFKWLPVSGGDSGYDLRFFDDGYPLLHLSATPTLDGMSHTAIWGLAACGGYDTFEYEGEQELRMHPWQNEDWSLEIVGTYLYLIRSKMDVPSLDGWVQGGHEALTCDGVSLTVIEETIASLTVAYFEALLEQHLDPDLSTSSDLTLDESQYPE
jgi:hypothetical protein